MKISMEPYGVLPGGEQVYQYTLENDNGMQVKALNYGGIITNLLAPDREGKMADVVLGQKGMEQYLANPGYLGAAVGRNCNRIAGARLEINEISYALDTNDGENNLHSGSGGLSSRLFAAEVRSLDNVPALLLSCTMEDRSDGFPGNLTVNIAYALTDDNALMIDYRAASDQDTVINLTNHSYFNLAGHDSGPIDRHVLELNAPFFTPNHANGVPTGEILSVEGTPFDFRSAKEIGREFGTEYEQVRQFGGYDHNMVLAGEGYRRIAVVSEPESGRIMEIYTDMPGVQFYTANMLGIPEAKDGAAYGVHQGFCMETQYFPDAVHMPWLASPISRAGQEYASATTYRFLTR